MTTDEMDLQIDLWWHYYGQYSHVYWVDDDWSEGIRVWHNRDFGDEDG